MNLGSCLTSWSDYSSCSLSKRFWSRPVVGTSLTYDMPVFFGICHMVGSAIDIFAGCERLPRDQ